MDYNSVRELDGLNYINSPRSVKCTLFYKRSSSLRTYVKGQISILQYHKTNFAFKKTDWRDSSSFCNRFRTFVLNRIGHVPVIRLLTSLPDPSLIQ